MDNKNILTVIDELGALLERYKGEIQIKDWEINKLHKKINQIESCIDFYAENTVTQEDYENAIKRA